MSSRTVVFGALRLAAFVRIELGILTLYSRMNAMKFADLVFLVFFVKKVDVDRK